MLAAAQLAGIRFTGGPLMCELAFATNNTLPAGAEAAVHMAASVSGMLGGAGAAQRGRPHARARAGSPRPPRAGATG